MDAFKYLGVTLDQTLNFKNHVKKLNNTLKFNLINYRHIRNSLTVEASHTYLNDSPTSFQLHDKLVPDM